MATATITQGLSTAYNHKSLKRRFEILDAARWLERNSQRAIYAPHPMGPVQLRAESDLGAWLVESLRAEVYGLNATVAIGWVERLLMEGYVVKAGVGRKKADGTGRYDLFRVTPLGHLWLKHWEEGTAC